MSSLQDSSPRSNGQSDLLAAVVERAKNGNDIDVAAAIDLLRQRQLARPDVQAMLAQLRFRRPGRASGGSAA